MKDMTPFLSTWRQTALIVLMALAFQLSPAMPALAQQDPGPSRQQMPAEEIVPLAQEEGAPVLDQLSGTLAEHDLSVWGMFMMADWVVRGVMIVLVLASLVTWTVLIAKALEMASAKRRARQALDRIVAAKSLADAATALGRKAGPAVLFVRAAEHEIAMTKAMMTSATPAHPEADGIKERVASHLGRIEAQAGRSMTRGTGILATIGSTAPFVGLFGTVWGIMNAFIGIAEAQTTNLAVVAPGIAEALLATALGLVAAIPAVVIYNGFARSISGYRLLLGDASAAVERLVSREFDLRSATDRDAAPQAAE